MVEEITYTPRFLPFSLSNPVSKVSCGAKYTIFVTKLGDVWACGGGECGQLGNGRCTFQEIPKKITFNGVSTQIVDAAAGWGHVIACSVSGEVYSWGMNKHGQLGLGDTATRFKPVKLSGSNLRAVYANMYSSAGIDSSGRLFTWGCGTHFRLMHGSESHLHSPTEVTSMGNNAIDSFAFSLQGSAAMALTTIHKVICSSRIRELIINSNASAIFPL